MSQAVDATRGSGYDYDEMAEEDRERKMRKQLNNLFSKFVAKVRCRRPARRGVWCSHW